MGSQQRTERNNAKKNTKVDSEVYNIIYSLKANSERDMVFSFLFKFSLSLYVCKATHWALKSQVFSLIFVLYIWWVCAFMCGNVHLTAVNLIIFRRFHKCFLFLFLLSLIYLPPVSERTRWRWLPPKASERRKLLKGSGDTSFHISITSTLTQRTRCAFVTVYFIFIIYRFSFFLYFYQSINVVVRGHF